MTRDKHGDYNSSTGLPANTGKPVGSGWIIQFHQLVIQKLGQEGEDLIAESRQQRSQYTWLCKQLQEQGHAELATRFVAMRKEEAAAARRREKARQIRVMEATIERNETPESHQASLRRRITKLRQSLLKEHLDDN